MAKLSDAQIDAAEARGRVMLETEPCATSARFDAASGRVVLELANGCAYAFPAALVEDLQNADAAALADVLVDGAGFNLHWPRLEVDLYVPALVAGFFGTRRWLTQELARIAGSARSPAKAAASRANGAKGGRPRKTAA
ncbi:MAG: DUF2442 domain-containing protein [Elsteraceae bacterium]